MVTPIPNAKLMFVNPPLTTSPGTPWANNTTMATTPLPKRSKIRVPKNSAASSASIQLGDLPQLGHAPDLYPLHHEDVAVVIEDRSVRIDELAGHECAPVRSGARRILRSVRLRPTHAD